MRVIQDDLYVGVVRALRSYQYGNAATQLAEEMAEKLLEEAEEVPEGCTPTDARVLRMANHDFAENVAVLKRALQPFAQFNSSEPMITIQIPTAIVQQARAALASVGG